MTDSIDRSSLQCLTVLSLIGNILVLTVVNTDGRPDPSDDYRYSRNPRLKTRFKSLLG